MSREAAIERALAYFDSGRFTEELSRRVAIPTESQDAARRTELHRYLTDEMRPTLEPLGFECRVLDNPNPLGGPVLYAGRIEDAALPTVLAYGHGDVVLGKPAEWSDGLDPWRTRLVGERLYGRGTADNKGQHTINLGAIAAVLAARGRLGVNCKLVLEMSEERGSPGLREVLEAHRDLFAADVLIASDGPRLTPKRPTVTLGSRGSYIFTLTVDLREGGHHSGHWGGLIANPGIVLAHALASLTTPGEEILIPEWKPGALSGPVRAALAECVVEAGPAAPGIDPNLGEPGLSLAEKLYGWSSFNILAFVTGDPAKPVNAVPPRAQATCQIRFPADCDPEGFLPALRRHLDERGFQKVEAAWVKETFFPAARTEPDHPWVRWTVESIERTTGARPHVCPNAGGALPTKAFIEVLGLPTVFVPHSYAGCQQHGPDEHLLMPIAREALGIMAGLFWDLGEGGTPA